MSLVKGMSSQNRHTHGRRGIRAIRIAAFGLLIAALSSPLSAMDYFGVCVHLAFGQGEPEALLRMVKEAGFNSFRDEYDWRAVESVAGERTVGASYRQRLELADRFGLMPLTMLGYANPLYDKGGYPRSPEAVEAYIEYAKTLAAVREGKPAILQVWNEWEGGTGMPREFVGTGDVPSYIQLLKKAYPALRAAAPEATILSNSYQRWQDFQIGLNLNLTQSCDGVVMHTYNYFHGKGATAEAWEGFMKAYVEPSMTRAPGRRVPLYITETGWPTSYGDKGTSEQNAAAQHVRLWLLAQKFPQLKGLWIYDFTNDGWDPKNDEQNFGIVRPDLTPKDSFYALRGLLAQLRGAKFQQEVATGRSDIHLMRFEHPDKRISLVMWSSYPSDDWRMTLKRSGNPVSVRVAHAGYPEYERTWDGSLSMTLGMLPIVVTGPGLSYESMSVERIPRPAVAPNTPETMRLPKHCLLAESIANPPEYRPLPLQEVWHGDKQHRGEGDLSVEYQVSYDCDVLQWCFKIKDDILQTGPVSDLISLKVRHPRAGNEEGNYLELTVKHPSRAPRLFVDYAAFPMSKTPTLFLVDGVYTLRIPAAALGVKSLERGDVLEVRPQIRDFDNDRAELFTLANFGTGEYQYLLLK